MRISFPDMGKEGRLGLDAITIYNLHKNHDENASLCRRIMMKMQVSKTCIFIMIEI